MNLSYISQQGQTLIEALSAMAVIALILSAIAVAVITSLNNATYDQNQTLATKYAEEGSELMRELRDEDYKTFLSYSGNYCLGKGQTKPGPSCSAANIDKTFLRQVQITQKACNATTAKVSVSVSFADGKCAKNTYCHSTINTTCLSTLNPLTAP